MSRIQASPQSKKTETQLDEYKGLFQKVKKYKKEQVVYKKIEIKETANNLFIQYAD